MYRTIHMPAPETSYRQVSDLCLPLGQHHLSFLPHLIAITPAHTNTNTNSDHMTCTQTPHNCHMTSNTDWPYTPFQHQTPPLSCSHTRIYMYIPLELYM